LASLIPSSSGNARIPAAVAAAGMLVLDLASCTLSNPAGLFSAGTSSLGTTSLVKLNTGIQAEGDAGRDGVLFSKVLASGFDFSKAAGVLCRVSASAFGGPGSGAIGRLRLGVVTTQDIATAQGALAGLEAQSAGSRYMSSIVLGSNGTVQTTSLGAVSSFYVWIPFNASGPFGAISTADGPSGDSSWSAMLASTPADLILGVQFGNNTAHVTSPAWENLVVEYQVVYL